MYSVDREMDAYREISRSLWNKYVFQGERVSVQASLDFDVFDRAIFKQIVLMPYGMESLAQSYLKSPILFPKLAPISTHENLSILIEDDKPGDYHTFAEHDVSWLNMFSSVMFQDFFDWDSYGMREMNLIRGVAVLRNRPEKTSRRIVIVERELVTFQSEKMLRIIPQT